MPHIHDQPGQHDTTASAYIVRMDQPEPVIVLHRHRLLKKFLQFGGHVELDEDPWRALAHELAEESGYNMNQLEVLQPPVRLHALHDATLHPTPVSLITHTFPGLDHFHTDIAFAFVTHELPAGDIGAGESRDVQTFTAQQLADLPAEDIPPSVREVGLFTLGECLQNWEPVAAARFASRPGRKLQLQKLYYLP